MPALTRCSILIALLLVACPPTPPQDDTSTNPDSDPDPDLDDVVVLTNTAHGCVRFMDYSGAQLRAEVCFDELLPEQCSGTQSNGWAVCQAFSVIYDRQSDPESLIMVFARQAESDEDIRPGGVVAMDLSWPVQPKWRIHEVSLPESHAMHSACLDVHASLGPDGVPDIRSAEGECYTVFPHELAWMPGHELLALSDTTLNRVIWFEPPTEGTVAQATAVLEPERTTEASDDRTLNCLEIIEHDGRALLLNSFKTSTAPEAAGKDVGRLMLWDVTDLDHLQHVWTYPSEGHLAAVHGPSLWETEVGLLLTYAHSSGASTAGISERGTVGMALASWDHPPVYLGDVLPPTDALPEPMGFVRDVKLVRGELERMLVLDSGCETPFPSGCDRTAQLLELDVVLPDLTGMSGAFSELHTDQSFSEVPMERSVMNDGLLFPFEVQHLLAEDVGPGLRSFLDEGREWLSDDANPEDSGAGS